MINKLFNVLLLVFCVCAQAQASEDRSLFWQTRSATATVYLLGSIHYADKSFYPLRNEIERAFEKSDRLVVEVDMASDDIANFSQILANEGTYTGKQTIKDHVSPETYEQLKLRLQQLDIPLDYAKKQKPGVLVMTLASAQVMKLGFNPEQGIDLYFINKARGNREIIPLETMEEQLRLFLDIKNGELLLKESLHSMDESQALMDKMVTIWKQGDEVAMNKLLFEEALEDYPAFTSIYDSLFYERNYKMTGAIKHFLRKKGSYFVVVGAGHLVGEEGIVNLLRQAGYEVKRL